MASEWQKKVLSSLLEKYENSKTYMGNNRVNQNFFVLPSQILSEYQSDYANLERIREFEQQMKELEESKFVFLRYQANEIEKIVANPEQWEQYYQVLGRRDKRSQQKQLTEIYQKYESCSLLCHFGIEQQKRIQENKNPKYKAEDAKNIFRLCQFLEENQEDILEREFSIAVLGDSKLWTTKYKTAVCRLLMESGNYTELLSGVEEKEERERLLLEEFQVFANPTYVYMKGNACLRCADGREFSLYGDLPMAISLELLNQIVAIQVFDGTVMTVENLTSFHRIQKAGTLFVFLSGYHNQIKQKLLFKMAKDNPQLRWQHFGDIDPDGFYIAKNLREKTGLPFELYCMDIQQLEQYKDYTKPLEKNDRAKAENLKKQFPFAEIMQYMLEHNCKLEQEIISWMQSRS